MHLSDRAFRRLVDEALAQVPEAFQPYLEGVSLTLEDWPSVALQDDLGLEEDEALYGLYTGRALTEGPPQSGDLPPHITLFRGPLLEDCEDEADLRQEITTTVIHEIAHHFGVGEDRLEELGWG
jgi:predicted Zn-dependent protease with MMP-like domain